MDKADFLRRYKAFMQNEAVAYPVQLAYETACEHFGKHRVKLNLGEIDEKTTTEGINQYCGRYAFSGESSFHPEYLNWQRQNIILHFPTVTVTNEKMEHTTIHDLFVLVPFTEDGRVLSGIYFLKTTFTNKQYQAGYIHSHTPTMYSNEIYWQHVCLGTGPINGTIRTINAENNRYDAAMWELYFWEIEKLVQVESLDGGPYIRIESIKGNFVKKDLSKIGLAKFSHQLISKDLLKAYIKSGKLKFVFRNNKFCIATPFVEWYKDFSNYVRNYYAAIGQTPSSVLFQNLYCDESDIYDVRRHSQKSLPSDPDKVYVTLNGVDYKFKLIDDPEDSVLQPFNGVVLSVALSVLGSIELLVNNKIA